MTENPMPDPSMLKMGAVALGGYVLGRLKKGRAAVGFAMWAAGVKADPKQLLRQGLINFASSAEGQQLLSQLRGPLLEAGKKAAGATIEGQVAALTAALQQRTSALTDGAQKATGEPEQAGDAAGAGRRRSVGETGDRRQRTRSPRTHEDRKRQAEAGRRRRAGGEPTSRDDRQAEAARPRGGQEPESGVRGRRSGSRRGRRATTTRPRTTTSGRGRGRR